MKLVCLSNSSTFTEVDAGSAAFSLASAMATGNPPSLSTSPFSRASEPYQVRPWATYCNSS